MRTSEKLMQILTDMRVGTPVIMLGDREVIHKMLVNAYQIIVASGRLLLEATVGRDPISDYYMRHYHEEKDHAEWLAEDLATVGVDVQAETVNPLVAQFVGMQYYFIKHMHPAMLLGYMTVLECFPTQLEDIRLLENLYGKELMRTLRFHAEHDIDHGKEVLAVIDTIEDENVQKLVISGAIASMEKFNELGRQLT